MFKKLGLIILTLLFSSSVVNAEMVFRKGYSSSDFDTDFGNKTTDNLTQGTTNKYYSTSLFNTDFGNKTLDDLPNGVTYVRSHNDFTDTLKTKLDGVENNANNYSLPIASATVLGGIKVGDRLTISSGVLSADVQSGDDLDVITVGANGDYTTIQAALNAAIPGDTILVSEGTYTEAITFGDDNITLKATGSKENTEITQAAATVVSFSNKEGCVLEGFKVNLTAADGNTDYAVVGWNDTTTNTPNIIRNCKFKWAGSADLHTVSGGKFTNGWWEIIHSEFDIDYSFAGNATMQGIDLSGADNVKIIHSIVDFDRTNNTASSTRAVNIVNATPCNLEIRDSKVLLDIDGAGYGYAVITQSGAHTVNIYNSYLRSVKSATSTCVAYYGDGGSTAKSYNSVYEGSTKWCWISHASEVFYSYGDTVLTGTLNEASGTAYIYNLTDLSGRLLSEAGIVIGQKHYDSTYHIDDASNGADTGTLYIGNASINVTFTGHHYYQLGDLDLQAGELVKLVDKKVYRTDTKKDPKAIGVFHGVSNSKDSLGNILLEDKIIDEGYEEMVDGVKVKKFRKRRLRDKLVRVTDKMNATSSDFAYSVAVVGDSYDEHDKKPLTGAWVTVKAGVIKTGNLLCSSDKPGYLEKQDDDIIHSYTVGKAREDINADTKNAYIYLLQ